MAVVPTETLEDEIARRAARFASKQERRLKVVDGPIAISDVRDENENDTRRYCIGLDCIDAGMGPLRPGNLTTVAAHTGIGKTSLLEICARKNAEKWCTFLATLEMTEAEIQGNMLARDMALSLDNFERERSRGSKEYREALDRLRSLNLHLWRPPVGRAASAEAIFKLAQRAQADMLLIDYTKHLDGWRPGDDAGKIVGYIAAQSQATGIHTILLAQLQLDAIGKRPTLAHLEDTKRLAHAAVTVILIHRPFAGKDAADVVAEMIIAKNRKGRTFRGHTHWYGPTHTFYTMSREEESRVQCCGKKPAAKLEARPADGLDVQAEGAVLTFHPSESKLSKAEEDDILAHSFFDDAH